ncbi:hypothetical protein AgCh_030615 [Apium graveolens]
MMTKTKKNNENKSLFITEQDIEAALQLMELKNHHQSFVTARSDQHLRSESHEPFMKMVLKSKEFLEAQDIKHDKKNSCSGGDENIRRRKRDGTASCSSSITFDLEDNIDENANEGVCCVKKMKKFRSIVDIYNVTKPL